MTQFVMIRKPIVFSLPPVMRLLAVDSDFDPAPAVAAHYLGRVDECYLIVDHSGRAEPLVDDVWEAQQKALDIANTPFAQTLATLIQTRSPFVCWCGSDYLDLPAVHTISELLVLLESQTAVQPADFYAQYVPK